jgi:hypothetical protein
MAIIQNESAYNAAIKRNIIANAQRTWASNTPRHGEIEAALEAGRLYDYKHVTYTDNFIGNLAKAFDTFGKLTPNQSAAVLKGIDARAARRAEWSDKQAALNASRQHIGTVGQKVELELTVKKIIEIEGAKFSYYSSGITYLYIMEDADQNVVIYKGNGAAFRCVDEGSTYRFVATVKEHGVRNDVKQTIIQRPKFVDTKI